ncbi:MULTISPECIES: GbsR/MarR family transcriptional regulator [Chryseobacterium]|uniref:HTH-type transcriptional regulator n=1 Tax=Chryseobacterium camelliae TaxID=1265445 RepID=A0ABU0TKH0_9FLAO|nr:MULTISPECIES: transcriptional regulator [Chryseobacterium]MDT3409351.1 DNA-binding transcriptional regulator GbsR (MarR family) [Pseudacidovorax intermedius]MDQ1096785.1 DNA-binding transcriptional regulator GbsR (MarR family) [Chryseobacterium camelliae]MDQ1100727.1 DNA-binding transcriptional regulator GbsR (MarR family) [Chryseobacterium sp. SORGH_AS_1048]MDR6088066.1 DNA-binding transcriptional regulator GbsR (MarR family) [Chryseobacterium sp. SORGH_AS_0909]MDR6132441.1 DNA-binding tra
MKLSEAKEKYIQTWGTFATNWGINRTMAQVHALLISSVKPLSTDEVMEQLEISRGNANMNLRALMDWGIVRKEFVKGDRKEYFVAEKDIWFLFKQITKERRKREIEPVIAFLEELKDIDDKDSDEAKEFIRLMDDFSSVTGKINNIMDLAIKSDDHWLVGKITNLLK